MGALSTIGGTQTQIPLYSTELVYQVNVSQNATLQFIQVTIPQSILQQQLQYCKTYDPFITNNISVTQCDFAYPAMAIVYNSTSGSQVGYEISYFIVPASYDNVTGLPNTFDILLNNRIGVLGVSSTPYFVYILYPSPYYLSFESLFNSQSMPQCPSVSSLPYATTSNFDGGWCSDTGGFGANYQPNSYLSYQYPYAQSLYYSSCANGCIVLGGVNITRYLYVTFNPQYPVLVGFMSVGTGPNFGGYVTVENPSTGQTQTLSINGGDILYDLRMLELGQGLNPYQWNEIVDVKHGDSSGVCTFCGAFASTGIYLQYVPQ
jgi:hypothetical protein